MKLRLERVLRDQHRDKRVVIVTINGEPWVRVSVRKAHVCSICGSDIPVEAAALKPLYENAKRGVHRYLRVCLACTEGR